MCVFSTQVRRWLATRIVRGEGTGELAKGAEEAVGERGEVVGWTRRRLHRRR